MGSTLFWVAFIAAFLSAACYSVGSLLQQIGTHRSDAMATISIGGVASFFKQVPYVIGLIIDSAGFILFLYVSHIMPLFFVQSVQAFGIVITVIISRIFLKKRLIKKEYYMVAGIIAGLVAISFTAAPEAAHPAAMPLKIVIIAAPLVLVGIVVLLGKTLKRKAMLAAMLGGVSFSGVAIASRMMSGSLDPLSVLSNPLTWSILVYAALGLSLFSMALQNGLLTHIDAVVYVVEIIIPTLIGLVFLGDHPRPGTEWLLYIGLILVTGSIVVLALSHHDLDIVADTPRN